MSEKYNNIDQLDRAISGFMSVCDWSKSYEGNLKECLSRFDNEQVKAYLKIKGIAPPTKKEKNPYEIYSLTHQITTFQKEQPVYYDEAGLWWFWHSNEQRWKQTDEVDILNAIAGATGADVISSKKRTEILNALKQVGRLNRPIPFESRWVQFGNKIYDLDKKTAFKPSAKYFGTNPLPYSCADNEDTPTIDRLFKEWVGQENTRLLYEILAYCALPDYPIHRIFCLIGEGLNGKSTFLRLLEKFVGFQNVTSTELERLAVSRFEVAKLYKRLVCVLGETNFSQLQNTGLLKSLSGNDLLTFEFKGKTPIDARNYAKIVIATNNLPSTTDKTIGFYRRWVIIDFPNSFHEKVDVLKMIPEEEYSALSKKCLRILCEVLKNGAFTNEGSIRERQQKFEDHAEPIDKFLKENCEEDANSHIFKFEFEKRLNDWLSARRFRTMSDVTIGMRMKMKGYTQDHKVRENESGSYSRVRAWVGLKWINRKFAQPAQGAQVGVTQDYIEPRVDLPVQVVHPVQKDQFSKNKYPRITDFSFNNAETSELGGFNS